MDTPNCKLQEKKCRYSFKKLIEKSDQVSECFKVDNIPSDNVSLNKGDINNRKNLKMQVINNGYNVIPYKVLQELLLKNDKG